MFDAPSCFFNFAIFLMTFPDAFAPNSQAQNLLVNRHWKYDLVQLKQDFDAKWSDFEQQAAQLDPYSVDQLINQRFEEKSAIEQFYPSIAIVYNPNKTVSILIHGTDYQQGSWDMSEDGQILAQMFNGEQTNYHVLSIDSNRLKIKDLSTEIVADFIA